MFYWQIFLQCKLPFKNFPKHLSLAESIVILFKNMIKMN